MKAVFNAKREEINNFLVINYKKLDGAFHFQSPIELLFVHKGEAKVWINDTEATVGENELSVVLSFDIHIFLSISETGVYTILFVSPDMCPAFMEAVRYKNAHNHVVRDVQTVELIGRALDMLADDGLNDIEQTGYINLILGSLLKQIKLADMVMPSNNALPTRLFTYINEHYKEDISANKISQVIGYNRHYLSKCFKATFQMSINSYINTLRLKNAVMMMRDENNSITKCAIESGFGSMRTFYRAFAEEFGCAPREYLKHIQRANGRCILHTWMASVTE
ncbi:MAG: helix-turn-helix transcriptional regulator [Clostridia bacterium]|nr:helix-turn-helix transcriptional regulator [Clostridia bacterium]